MKKSMVVLVYATVLLAIVAWNTRAKYLSGTGIFYSIKSHGLDAPTVVGVLAGVVVVAVLYVRGRRR